MDHYADIVSPERIEKMIFETLLAMEDQAVKLTKVDTGALRNSISIATSKREKGFNSRPGAKAPEDAKVEASNDDMEGVIGTALPYAAAKEFGLPEKPNYPADPYLRPAALMVRTAKNQIAAETFEKEIKQYLNRFPFRGLT